MKHIKIKILLILSFIILAVSTVITVSNLYHEKEENDRRLEEAYRNVERTYEETIRDTIHFYQSRAEANLKTPGIMSAFRDGDHDKLYTLMRQRWEVMQRENPSLIVMQFHKADGVSLLRLHQPEIYGDKIADQRSMVAFTHATGQAVSGFEEGRQGLAFRILAPVFDQGVYIGAVEFGIAPPYFTDKIYRLAGYNAFFFVNQGKLGQFGRIDRSSVIGNYVGIAIPAIHRDLIQQYANTHTNLQNGVITHNEQTYEINVLNIKDYQAKPVGAIMFIRATSDFQNYVRHVVAMSGVIAILLLLVIGFIVERIYTFIMLKMSFQERYAQMILDSVPTPVIVTDGLALIAANSSFLSYLHYETVQSFKHDHACVCEYFEEGDTDEYLMPMHNDRRWTEYILAHPLKTHKAKITVDGITTVFEVRISVLSVNADIRYVVIFSDISMLQLQTMTDPLTQIANRLHFSTVYQHAINVARREKNPLGFIFIDIDHFKNVNDTYGHPVGDTVLKKVAAIISKRMRKSDIFARWGGEEFVLLLPNTTADETIKVAEILRIAIASEEIDTVGGITCSFGVAMFDENDSAETLLKRADDKLYEAKLAGRNKVMV